MPERMSISAMKLPNGGKPTRAKVAIANTPPEKGNTRITPARARLSLVRETDRNRPAGRQSSAFTNAALTTYSPAPWAAALPTDSPMAMTPEDLTQA